MTKKEINVSLKTLGIKAKVVNTFRTEFYKKTLDDFTDEQKEKIFDRIFSHIKATHNTLVAYKNKRKFKAKIEKLRKEKKDLAKSE